MATAMPELLEFAAEAEFQGEEATDYKHMYWRRPDGWIVTGPGWGEEYKKRMRRGFESLDQLGEFYLDKVHGMQGWSAHREPYRQLFAKGGADLVQVRQILELNWDINPPYKGVTFPQLEGVNVRREKCHNCNRKFVDTSPWGGYSCEERLERHEMMAHKEKAASEATARAIRDGVSGLMPGSAQPSGMEDLIKTLVAQNQELMTELRKVRSESRAPRKKPAAKAA